MPSSPRDCPQESSWGDASRARHGRRRRAEPMKGDHLKSSIFGASGREGEDEGPGDVTQVPATRRGHRRRLAEEHQREERIRRTQRRRFRRTRRMIVLLVALGLVVGTGAIATSVLWPMVTSLTASNDYTGGGHGVVPVVV